MTERATPATTAREYLRISLDRTGKGRSVDEQHNDNTEAAAEHGWALGEPYREAGDRSASRFAKKAREEYDRLTSDLEAGRFGAEYLIIWEASRGSREMGEWVHLVKLCERRAVKFYITSDDRVLDPKNDGDWAQLINLGQQSEAESRRTSKRVRRATRAAATAGRPHGQIPYGYRRIYGGQPPKMVGQEAEPKEAAVIQELYERIAAGHALRAVALDFEARGITRRDGGPFSQQHLRNLALRHCYAGKRLFVPGRGTESPGEPQVLDAIWPALVDLDLWQSVQRILTDPRRNTTRPGRANHLLSMIAACDVCDGPLTVLLPGGSGPNLRTRSVYKCQRKGCVKVPQADLDDLVEGEILTYLQRPDVYRSLEAHEAHGQEELTEVRSKMTEVQVELDELADSLGRGDISAAIAGRAEARITDRLAKLERREQTLSAPAALSLIPPGKDVRSRWEAAPMSARREVARALLTPAVLGQIRVTKSPYRGAPVSDRVVWATED